MRTVVLQDLAVAQDKHHITLDDGLKAMGNGDYCATLELFAD